jgi:hypothetical protein
MHRVLPAGGPGEGVRKPPGLADPPGDPGIGQEVASAWPGFRRPTEEGA